MKQRTIRDNIILSGIGLHNGERVNLKIKPAKPNSESFLKELISKTII